MGKNRTHTATDLRLNLDHVEARTERYSWIFLTGCNPWNGPNVPGQPCKVCHGGRLRRKGYCLGCDRTGLDDRVVFPGERISSRMDPHYRAEPTACTVPADGLKGGMAGKGRRSGKKGKKGRKRAKVRA